MLKAGPVGRSNRSGSRLLFLLPVTPDMERSAVSFGTAEERGGEEGERGVSVIVFSGPLKNRVYP